jgi:hypothetical protein
VIIEILPWESELLVRGAHEISEKELDILGVGQTLEADHGVG